MRQHAGLQQELPNRTAEDASCDIHAYPNLKKGERGMTTVSDEFDHATHYLRRSQTADRLRVTPRQVSRLTRAGRLAAVETPLGRLYAADEVERFAAEQRARAARPDGRVRQPAA